MGHFWWIVFIIVATIAVGVFVHPLAIAGPMLFWLAVEFVRAEVRRRR